MPSDLENCAASFAVSLRQFGISMDEAAMSMRSLQEAIMLEEERKILFGAQLDGSAGLRIEHANCRSALEVEPDMNKVMEAYGKC